MSYPFVASSPLVRRRGVALGALFVALPLALVAVAPLRAQAPSLGTVAGFGVLGGSSVANTGNSVVLGDVGVAPGTAITGFPPGSVIGTVHGGDAAAAQAQADVTSIDNQLAAMACSSVLSGQDLGGMTLLAGVHCYAAAAQLTGTLTLDAAGDPAALFVIRTGGALNVAAGAAVRLVNGADADHVFWQLGSAATIGADSAFVGNLIAFTSIALGTGASLDGRALARHAAVTMDTVTVLLPNGMPTAAAWRNYGVGWPGGAGVPTLVLSGLPLLGTTPSLVLQNVRGVPTFGLLMWGTGPVAIPTAFGGELQVAELYQWPTAAISTGSFAMPLHIPASALLSGMTADLQVLQFDEHATHAVAFTRGLHLVLGQ